MFDHLRDVLKIRDRVQIFIHHHWDYSLVNMPFIVAMATNHPFLKIKISNEIVVLESRIPENIPKFDQLGFLKPAPKNKKNRNKWRREHINSPEFNKVINGCYNMRPLQCDTTTLYLCDPKSIHRIEYYCNKIITKMISLLTCSYGLRLKEGVSHDFDLISYALNEYSIRH